MANPSYITVVIETSEDDLGVTAKLAPAYPVTNTKSLTTVAAYIESLAAQQPLGRVLVLCTTKTLAHTAAGYWQGTTRPADGTTFSLFGLVFTAKTTLSTNPTNAFEFARGADVTASMTNLAAAINANLFLQNVVTAAVSDQGAGIIRCTVTTTIAGAWGNTVPQLATSSALTLSAMAGGFTGGIANAGQGAHLSVLGLLT